MGQSILFNKDGGTPDASALIELRSAEKGFLPPRMKASERLSIVSPAQGLTVFQIDGTIGFYFYNGASWDTLGGATTVTNISNVTNITNSGIVVIRDLKSSGVDGGTFTSGAWQTRDLNDIAGDLSFVSLGTNDFKLDSGTYVITINAPAFTVDEHQIRLFNVTNSIESALGTISYSNKFAASISTLTAVVNVAASSEVFRVEHRCSATELNDGFGIGAPWGDNVYTQVQIQKL